MTNEFTSVEILVPSHKVGALYAAVAVLLGAASSTAIAASAPTTSTAPAPQGTATPASSAPVTGLDDAAGDTVPSDPSAIDAAGWPWSADLHAATKGQTKDGLWRMKVGVSRPDPKPGFPKDAAASGGSTGTTSDGAASAAPVSAPTPAASSTDDDDEFAAFAAAQAKTAGTDAAAAASVPARKWTDADLGALCNQAAVKLGDPAPIKALIAEHVPADTVPHSRNIPDDKREAFAKAVEAKAGITFAA